MFIKVAAFHSVRLEQSKSKGCAKVIIEVIVRVSS